MFILFLGVVEKLSRMANILSMERDWVPTLAPPSLERKGTTQYGLAEVNATMSRIDLICKLASPILISAFISAVGSVKLGVAAIAVMSCLSWVIEFWSARKVWDGSTRLKEPKSHASALSEYTFLVPDETRAANEEASAPSQPQSRKAFGITKILRVIPDFIIGLCNDWAQGMRVYMLSDVWMPSIAMCLQHISVLVFTATLTVHLLNAGYPLNLITVAQTLSAVFELSSTFITPWGIGHFSRRFASFGSAAPAQPGDESSRLLQDESHNDGDQDGSEKLNSVEAVSTVGLWALVEMFVCLVSFPGILILLRANLPRYP
jgi:solute carrier family 40 (iron-regulated transporter), member 1